MYKLAVISRFRENLDWIKLLEIPYKIYNKGIDSGYGPTEFECEIIPNTGRESETYLRFIIDNYQNLPEFIVFLQGNPFDHCPELFNDIQNNKQFLTHTTYKCDGTGMPHHPGLEIDITIKKIGLIPTNLYYFGVGAQYIVPKENILNRSLDWWKNVKQIHDENFHSPWIFERIWPIIFNLEQQ
jgi:hypothetical protein